MNKTTTNTTKKSKTGSTFKNKLCAISLLIIGWLTGDGTCFVFMAMFAIPLLLTSKDVFK